MSAELGVIGGTGVYKLEGLQDVEEVQIETPYGPTSSPIILGTIHGVRCAFLARHGPGHKYLPSEVPYRANIWAMKKIGVKYLMAVSACGSLREEIKPLDLVLVDQLIDKTYLRKATFFGEGVVAHVTYGEPCCAIFSKLIGKAIATALPDTKVHQSGTYVTMEGPQFSTKAESNMHRKAWDAHLIGMTAGTEAKLSREAEIAYSVVGLVTDYDCWHEEEADVDAASVIEILKKNGNNVQIFVSEVVKELSGNRFESPCHSALKFGIMSQKENVSAERKKQLEPLLSKYWN